MGEWRVGDVVDGRYRVTRVRGQGAMGLVHRVRHLGWNIDLAVKSPRPEVYRECLLILDGYSSAGARLTADGRFAVCDGSGGIEVWNAGTGRCSPLPDAKGDGLLAAVPTPDGRHVVCGDSAGVVRVWEIDWELAADGDRSGHGG
ncbi:hypothetical protein ACWC4E_29345 [Streptomyces sp. NPDC001273]|uniref:hypothetical protein n=1 Tax=unclassified Streptomyces TaxID=2593676 RepID=UPI0033CE89F5